MSKGEEAEAEPAQSSCPAYDELLKVMERATARLKKKKKKTCRGSGPRWSRGVKKKKKMDAFSSRIHRCQHTSYADIKRMRGNGYEGCPLWKRR